MTQDEDLPWWGQHQLIIVAHPQLLIAEIDTLLPTQVSLRTLTQINSYDYFTALILIYFNQVTIVGCFYLQTESWLPWNDIIYFDLKCNFRFSIVQVWSSIILPHVFFQFLFVFKSFSLSSRVVLSVFGVGVQQRILQTVNIQKRKLKNWRWQTQQRFEFPNKVIWF